MIPNDLLPPWAHALQPFIAGGYAACPALAQDVDVWLPMPDFVEWEQVQATRDQLARYLHETFGARFTVQDGQGSKRDTIPAWDRHRLLSHAEGYVMPIPIYRAGSVDYPGASLPYHLIVVGGDVDDVLSSFDITTHQVALTSKGVVRGEQWTPPWVRGTVLHQKYTTPERMRKLEARYGWAE